MSLSLAKQVGLSALSKNVSGVVHIPALNTPFVFFPRHVLSPRRLGQSCHSQGIFKIGDSTASEYAWSISYVCDGEYRPLALPLDVVLLVSTEMAFPGV